MATVKGNYSGGSSYDLYVSCVTNSQNIEKNTSNVTFTFGMYKAGSNSQSYNLNSHTFTYSINGTKYTKSVSFDFRSKGTGTYNKLFSVTLNITHGSDGKKSVSVSASHPTGISLGTGKVSTSFALKTIPRASAPTVSPTSQSLGNSITINTNRKSTSFTHKVVCTIGSYSKTISSVGGSTSFSLDKAIANQLPNATSGKVNVTCTTYSGSTNVGSKTTSFTVTVPNNNDFKPKKPTNTFVGNKLCQGLYVQNVSILNTTISSVGIYNSTIKNYSLNIGGKTYSSTSSKFSSSALPSSGEVAITSTVKDSRGYSNTSDASKITVYPYSVPTVTNFSAVRTDDNGSSLNISFDMALSAVNNKNNLKFDLYSKKCSEDGEPAHIHSGNIVLLDEGELPIGDNVLSYFNTESRVTKPISVEVPSLTGIPFSSDESFDIIAKFSDFNHTFEQSFILQTKFVTVDFKAGGKGVAIGKYSEEDAFEVDIPAVFHKSVEGLGLIDSMYPVGSIYQTTNASFDPNTEWGGKWRKLEGVFLLGSNSSYKISSDIKDGGEASHKLTVSEMPSHNHPITVNIRNANGNMGTFFCAGTTAWDSAYFQGDITLKRNYSVSNTTPDNAWKKLSWHFSHDHSASSDSIGGSGVHNNMPPYKVVNIWERIE
ncbi:DUF859 family phage minor structural protein [Anaerofustis stercorihominis]|uniref:Baseplate structural protein Gp10 C-terminal domain-containing protein n=2 Tax=Anaerofustis stercorihominis TaxID=214853 RepID=B1C5V1_9FIRM|nr:DUF859 family phage minor structural protein [Anaerofustis stercorihominis]EDS73520.1 hypothetical protein ANASTE_00089 [Anaerofustis stercorihominis DSM 17244]MCQ4794672.1 DUF859 family phage minor structural protein [Anaerofustis stercorihominis]